MKNRPAIRPRKGFSLAELLVAIVLLGIVGGALTRLVVDQMRFFDNIQVVRGARSAARNSMNVMLSELRMVQDSGGITNIASDNKSITVLVPYRFGVYCGQTSGTAVVSMLPVDSLTGAQATFYGYGWRHQTTGRYILVSGGSAPAVSGGNATVCTTTAGISTMTVNGRSGVIYDIGTTTIPTSTNAGIPVMFYQQVTYSFQSSALFSGKVGLYRAVNSGTAEELMAPFASTARFRYYVTGEDTSRTTAPSLDAVRGLALVLTTEGQRKPAGKNVYSQQKMMTSVFFKNVRAY